MHIVRLELHDFRCHTHAILEPAATVTALVGPNGCGKTSVIEAVAWLATGRSFRGGTDDVLARDGTESAVVRAEVVRGGREHRIEAEINRGRRNRMRVNGQAVPRARAFGETIRVTVFGPDDLELVKGGPAARRDYLDDLLAASVPRVAVLRSEYERVVRQRSALLRAGVRNADDEATLEVWNDQLVVRGADLVRHRLRLIDELVGPLEKAYAALAEQAPGPAAGVIAGRYEAVWLDGSDVSDDEEALRAALRTAIESARAREIERGQTLVGPHRDEWRLTIGGLDARSHASQGEQRSLALALRLAGHAVVADAVGESPILLLDDVFSELDAARADALVRHLPPGQTMVTTAAALPPDLRVEYAVRVTADGFVPGGSR